MKADACLCERFPTHQAEDCHVHNAYPSHFDKNGVQSRCNCGNATGRYPKTGYVMPVKLQVILSVLAFIALYIALLPFVVGFIRAHEHGGW